MPKPAPDTAEDWRRRARAFQDAHDLPAAFDACQRALALAPESLETVRLLAELAFAIGQFDMSEKFYAHLRLRGEKDPATVRAHAEALRETGRFEDAIDLLKPALAAHPTVAPLWETLGTVLVATGDRATGLIFFEEALRLAPDNLHARFHRGATRFDQGDTAGGLADVVACAKGFNDPGNRAAAELTAAHMALGTGDLAAGWTWYEGRHKRGTLDEVIYETGLPRWQPGQALDGARLFISAEQGLGDEVLFASLLPDLIGGPVGSLGHLGLGVEPRLVSLFQRSFPEATVVPHTTRIVDRRLRRAFPDLKAADFDSYALLGDFLRPLRSHMRDFPRRASFLTPDPDRVAYWRGWLAGLNDRPKAGVLWKSMKSSNLRDRYFAAFSLWQEVLTLPGIQFINLQYGDSAPEMAQAKVAGIDIVTPPGIDLKADLDDIAALTAALDVIIGPANATSNIAAAVGTPIWMLVPPHAWLQLKAPDYVWYPRAMTFAAPTFGDWAPALAEMRETLQATFVRQGLPPVASNLPSPHCKWGDLAPAKV